MNYRGRFAPTPSGPLHMGSLFTALASWLDARHSGGEWVLRIDDLDEERQVPGSVEIIQSQLRAHGLHWDGPLHYQSRRLTHYQETLSALLRAAPTYPCDCTRARLREQSLEGPDDRIYSGRCRHAVPSPQDGALRLAVRPGRISLTDARLGKIERQLETEVGDFVVRRASGTVAYQLASIADDEHLRITHVVRGGDLLGSSLRQTYLMQLLGRTLPEFLHLPVVTDRFGQKLSKQNHALPIRQESAIQQILTCLIHLGQEVPEKAAKQSVKDVLDFSVTKWDRRKIPKSQKIYLE